MPPKYLIKIIIFEKFYFQKCLNLPKLGARRGINQNPVFGVFPLKSHPTSLKINLGLIFWFLKGIKIALFGFHKITENVVTQKQIVKLN